MKSFIISTVLFLLLLTAIVFNALYVRSVSESILEQAEQIGVSFDENAVISLEEYWGKHRSFVGLTVGYRELDHVCETLISLRASCESGNRADAMLYLSLLKDAAEEMARHEELSVSNLF